MTDASRASPWWMPHVHADRRPLLLARGRIKTAIRQWFEAEGFVEVDTACLQVSPGNEAHLHAFATSWRAPDGRSHDFYLHTSPEFACKKLLAAGERRIFTFAPVFRNRERGALHHPEFTMLEWYRAGEPYETLMADCHALLRLAAEVTGHAPWTFRGVSVDPCATPERLSVADAFMTLAGIDILATVAGPAGDVARLAAAAAGVVGTAPDDTWSDLFSRILVARVEPRLGAGRPLLLDRYPRLEAALARSAADDPRVAERFELYVAGVEVANGFGELTDAVEQRRRFADEMAEKARVHGETYPVDEDFLAALAAMPPASGIALGFDRLVMLATGAERIEQVLWTPVADPGI
ncbi:MAG: EF-P lysine aminoacylase EpmA [Hyphomicrobiaceae bacterium]